MERRYMLCLSQKQLAREAMIERTRLQRIEHCRCVPSGEEKEFIALALASKVEECFPFESTPALDEGDMPEETATP
jgi:transcriptional regulator with XRE-family HTH domain